MSRKKGETITIRSEAEIQIEVASIRNGSVRLGITADPNRTTITVGGQPLEKQSDEEKGQG